MSQETDAEPLAEVLGTWVAEFDLDAVPATEELHERARLHILDGIGVALASSALEGGVAPLLGQVVEMYGASGAAQLIGATARSAPPLAAFYNGSLIHASEHDDTSYERVMHCESFAVPTVLAVGEWRGSSGRALAEAFCVATEVALRLARACDDQQGLWRQGFHNSAVFGCFGAAAGASKLLELDADAVANALSLATSFASGTNAGWGEASSRNKSLQPGWAALSGIHAALLASTGYNCAHTTIDGPLGLFASHAFERKWTRERVVAGLGDEWAMSQTTFKLHAAGAMMQSTLDAVARVVIDNDIQPDEVKAVELVVPAQFELAVNRFHDGSYRPDSPYGVAFSWPWATACMITDRRVGPDHQREGVLRDPAMIALVDRISHRADDDASLPPDDQLVFVTIRTPRGTFTGQQGRNLGYFSDGIADRVVAKFTRNARLALGADRVASLRDQLLDLDGTSAAQVAALFAAATDG